MKLVLTSMAVAAIALPMLSAHAAGPYDGTWLFEAPPVSGGSGDPYDLNSCAGVRFMVDIKDSQVVGNLRMAPYAGGGDPGAGAVTSSPGRASSPIEGTVQPDGKVNAQWQSFKASGNLSGNPQISWRGQCGPRTAAGQKVG